MTATLALQSQQQMFELVQELTNSQIVIIEIESGK